MPVCGVYAYVYERRGGVFLCVYENRRVCVCASMCIYVRERERDRYVSVYMCLYLCRGEEEGGKR